MDKRQAAVAISKALSDQGKLIEGGWQAFRMAVVPAGASEVQVSETRMAYFAGAQHLYGSIMTIMGPGEEPTEQDLKRMESVDAELKEFGQQLLLRLSDIGGHA